MSNVNMIHGYVCVGYRSSDKHPKAINGTFATSKTKAKTQLHHINQIILTRGKNKPYCKEEIVRATLILGEVVSDNEQETDNN